MDLSFFWFSCLYWISSFSYLYWHPPRHFGKEDQYPDYKPVHTLMKVAPLMIASLIDRTTWIIVVADSLLDLEYLNPKLTLGFYTACYSYQIYHLARIYQIYTRSSLLFDLSVIMTSLVAVVTVGRLLKLESKTNLLYIFVISVRLMLSFFYSLVEFMLVGLLGLGDCLLIYSKTNDVSYKDQITMMSTYVHVWGNLLLHQCH